MADTRSLKVTVDLTVAADADPIVVADALLDFLCSGGDDPWPEEIIQSVDGTTPVAS